MSDTFQNDPLERAQKTYSPLPMMVQRFKDMYGGRPAPRAPLNLEQQAAADDQKPEEGQPPMARLANSALPPGSPYPRQRAFQPFQFASIPRPHHQWGQEDPYPTLPQSFEVHGLLNGLSGYFSNNGGANIAQLALMMGPHAGAFLEGVQQGQLERAKEAREQLALRSAQLEERAKEQATVYSDIWGEHSALDPTMSKTIKGKTLLETMDAKAVEIGDIGPGSVSELIGFGATPSQVKTFLEHRDNRLRDLHATNKAMEDDTAEDVKYGLKPHPADTGRRGDYPLPGATDAPQPTDTAAVDPQTGKPAPAGAPAAKLPGDKDADDPFRSGTPEEQQTGESLASDVYRGIAAPKGTPKDVEHAAAVRASQIKRDIGNIIKDPAMKGRPDLVRKAVDKIDPTLGQEWQDYADYRKGPGATGQGGGGKEVEMWNDFGSLATVAHPGDPAHGIPGWSQSNWTAIARFKDSPQVQTAIGRAVTVTTTGDQLLNDIQQLPPEASDSNVLKRALTNIQNGGTADIRYVALYNDWLKYNQETNVLIRGGGSGGVTETGEAINVVPQILGSPGAYRTVVVHDAEMAHSRLQQYGNQWRQYGSPDPMPGSDQFSTDELHRIASIEPGHNLMPGETVDTDHGKMRWKGPYDERGHLRTDPTDNWEIVR